MTFTVGVLDDYQCVAERCADWRSLADADIRFFHDHVVDEDALVQRLKDLDAIVVMRERTPFPRSLLVQLPRLRLIVTTATRNAAIDVPAATESGITVCGTDHVITPATAELAWGLIISVARHIPAEDRLIRDGGWQRSIGMGLAGRTLAVLGLGRVGSRVARVGLAFEMRVIAWSENLTEERAREIGVTKVSRDDLFKEADVLTIHVLISGRTRGLVGINELALMKPTSILVNTSRGPIVDEGALVDALRSQAIAGAGLDVFGTEPLPPDHPFRTLPNVVVTPHLGYVTENNYRIYYRDAVEDIKGFRSGAPLRVITGSQVR